MRRREHERAADVDRDEIAERLRQAVTEGRLDLEEYDDRVARTYASKTYGELDLLVSDLPRSAPGAPAAHAPAAGDYPHAARDWLAEQWRPWTNVVLICVVIWLLTALVSAGATFFWPAWVAVPWGAVLVCRSIYGLASGEPQQWAAQQASRHADPVPRPGC